MTSKDETSEPLRLVIVEWVGSAYSFEAVELVWSDVEFRYFLPLRDAWIEPEALAIKRSAIVSVEELGSDAIARRVAQHWPTIQLPRFGNLMDSLERARSDRVLLGITVEGDEPDTINIGWIDSIDTGEECISLAAVDPEGRRTGIEQFRFDDVTSVQLESRWLQVLSLVAHR